MNATRWIRLGAVSTCLAALLSASPPARAAGNLTAVLESEVVFLDPHSTTASITRTFGYMAYDTLFSMDSKGDIHPQMVSDTHISDDRMTYDFTLRDGLKFSDGAPVTSADVVASLKRWGTKDSLGRMLMAATGSLEATSEKGFTLKLKSPFGLVLETLGKPNAVTPFIIPARQAADAKITEVIGSGPFIFRKELWRTGDTMVLDRNPAYVPRSEPADFLSGGKVVNIDRLTLKTIVDESTAASALRAGEIDYLQYVPFDSIGQLKAVPQIKLMQLGGLDMFQGNFRLNQGSAPFNDPAIRRVLWKLVDQDAMLSAIGIPPEFHLKNCKSYWMCGTPLSTDAGSQAATYSLDDARAELKATKYAGEPVVFMELPTSNTSMAPAQVMVDVMKKVGFNMVEQGMDWGTLLQRRAKKDGWNMFAVYSNGVDMESPLTHFYVGSNCTEYPGWSCDPRVTPLLAQFTAAGTLDERRKIAAEIQTDEYETVPSVMWGQFSVPTGYRTDLTGLIQSSFPIFWSVTKTGKS